MTNTDEITIFDEIVNCGILEEDSITNFGAGFDDGKFLETLIEYNGSLGEGLVKGIEPDSKKIKLLTKKFKNQNIEFYETSMQDYIDTEPQSSDWVIFTGVFDNHLYGEKQHDFVIASIESCLSMANKGIILSIKEEVSNEFVYSVPFFFSYVRYNYQRFTIKKVDDGNYIFCIFK